ncbi:T9SS type A sorting domain-containing protein [candidate division WOR-3 bacterium]|nr:T9SS type A sorting domain-containing protein [candidate division WOR-3 bacterium]
MVSKLSLVLGVLGLLFMAAGQGFFSETPLATAYNQGRHLALDPTTGWLHLVYAYGDADTSPIYYSHSPDHGTSWSQIEEVGRGTGPCIVCEDGRVWVSYWRQTERKVFAAIRVPGGESPWVTFELCASDAWSAPAMAVCRFLPYPNAITGVYVVYNWFDVNTTFYVIVAKTVAFPTGVVGTKHIHAVPGWFSQFFTPSVASTPGGELGPEYVHIAWCTQPTHESDPQLWFSRVVPPHGQEPAYRVSGFNPDMLEPVFNPSVEGYGDSVYVVWRAKEQGDEYGMIWRAQRHLEFREWEPYLFVDLDDPSFDHRYTDCPQMSTRWAHVWHERKSVTAHDIWANMFMCGPTIPLQEDPLQSMYPSTVLEFPAWAPVQPFVALYTVWTNEIEPGGPFKVKFLCDTFYVPPQDGFKSLVYYDAQVADSVKSRYCMARDGFKRWRDYAVDFGRDSLKYRLYYLNPNYDYLVMAVLFHGGRSVWEQSFALDSVQVARVRFRPEVPETVLVYVPRETYARDFRADLDIRRLAGDYAVLSELRVFQCYPYRRRPGGTDHEAGLAGEDVSAVRLMQLGPSPFAASTVVSYVVTQPRRLEVSVYDVLGRQIRRLASGRFGPGNLTAGWDGLDEVGSRALPGVYLVRLQSDGRSHSGKVVLSR